MRNRLTLKAVGIVCSGCAMDMENVLMTRDGIMNVEVNFSDGIVQVLYDAAELTEKKVHELVEELGFKSKILSSEKI